MRKLNQEKGTAFFLPRMIPYWMTMPRKLWPFVTANLNKVVGIKISNAYFYSCRHSSKENYPRFDICHSHIISLTQHYFYIIHINTLSHYLEK